MLKKRIIAVLLSVFCLVGCSTQTVDEPMTSVQKDSPAMEDDYYASVNAGMLRDAALYYGNNEPALSEEQLYALIEDCITDTNAEGCRADVRTLYTQFLDTDTRDTDGITVLRKGLDVAADAQTVSEYLSALAFLYREYGCEVLFRPVFVQDPYDSSSYICQLGDISFAYRPKQAVLGSDDVILSDQRAFEIILPMLGYAEEDARTLSRQICLMLLDIAEHSMEDIGRISVESTYHPYDMASLNALYGGADIAGALAGLGISGVTVNVFDEGNAAAAGSYLTEENLPMLRAYAQLCLINTYARYLPQSYADAAAVLGVGNMPEEEAAVYMLDDLLREELDVLYYDTYHEAGTQAEVTRLCGDILDAYKALVQANMNFSEDGKSDILQKLEHMIFLIGGTSAWEAAYDLSPECGFLENAVQIRRADAARNLEKANEAPDRTRWEPQSMPSYEVNGLYDKSRNSITITEAAIQERYVPDASYAENLGNIGFMIAHEISHAFDSNCMAFDAEGNYAPDTLGEADHAVYIEMQERVEAYFSAQTIVGLYHVDGKTTLGENMADIAAVQCLVTMLDNDADKRTFFEAYAQLLGSVSTIADVVDALGKDEHAPAEIRCNAVLSLTEEFYDVYGIVEGDGMYVAPADRIRVW